MTSNDSRSAMPHEADMTDQSVITAADQLRIRQAMNRTPFSASSRVPIPYYLPVSGCSEPVTVTSIVTFLDGLSEVITEQTTNADEQRRRLNSLEADVKAFRQLIGTTPAEVKP